MSLVENRGYNLCNETVDAVKSLLDKQFIEIPLAYVHSFGCQQNTSDTEKIKGLLSQMGYAFTDSPQKADFVLYNTCAVRETAEMRVYGNIGELKRIKAEHPQMIIALCGCMMQQQHVVDKIKKSYPFVDILFGTGNIHNLPLLVYNKLFEGKNSVAIAGTENIVEDIPTKRDGTVRAWVPIMNGCNNFCTYCIVPYVRGREVSRQSDNILKEVRQLVLEGYKEITLLGQNVNSYGKNLDLDFSALLVKLNAIEGNFRIRFMTSHPKDCTKRLIDTIAACEKVCSHIHLPFQSGNNRILKLMNRGYTKESYLNLVEYAKKTIPQVTFSSDIIVGFPGESYEEFLDTVEIIKQVEFEALYTFIYSKRTGTKSAQLEDSIPAKTKAQWMNELLAVQQGITDKRHGAFIGKTLKVLVEEPGKTGEQFLSGHTEGNVLVEFIASKQYIGSFVYVKISSVRRWALFGEIINNK